MKATTAADYHAVSLIALPAAPVGPASKVAGAAIRNLSFCQSISSKAEFRAATIARLDAVTCWPRRPEFLKPLPQTSRVAGRSSGTTPTAQLAPEPTRV